MKARKVIQILNASAGTGPVPKVAALCDDRRIFVWQPTDALHLELAWKWYVLPDVPQEPL